jgi:uncharacterized protein (DUF1499 family)
MRREFLIVAAATTLIASAGMEEPNSVDSVTMTFMRFSPCPDTPNCVSTFATDKEHAIEPLPALDSVSATMDLLVSVVGAMKRTSIVEREDLYLRTEYRTRLGFVDDVEFLIEPENQIVHFRSASRVGYSDIGVNRRRMEEFRSRYEDARS